MIWWAFPWRRLSRLPAALRPAEADIVIATAKNAAENYVNNLGTGAPLLINEVASQIRNSDSRISDVGKPNNQIPEIYTWRTDRKARDSAATLVGGAGVSATYPIHFAG